MTTTPTASSSGPAERLVRNSLINFGGHTIPLVAGILAIPVLVGTLGPSRFGILTLSWTLVGYFGLFDLGLGRALTKLVSERLRTPREAEIGRLVWTALALMFLCGSAGGALGVVLASWVTSAVLRIPVELQQESAGALRLLALSLPFVITSAGLRGLLEAMHRFGWVNAIRIPLGVFTFVGPLLVVPFSQSLEPIVGVLVAARAAAWLAHLLGCVRALPWVFRTVRIDAAATRLLLGFGGWMTVSNIVGPLMTYMDRFLIGAVVSAAAVAYYATPYEVITKLWLVPGALLAVLFPTFSAGLHHDPERVRRIFVRATELLLLVLFPAALLAVLFAEEGLTVWLGSDFASRSASVAKWLAPGVLINSLALVPFTLIQSGGRPDLTAKLHILELPPYLFGLWWLTSTYGVEGAAAMWTARCAADAVLLFALARPFLAGGAQVVRHILSASLLPGIALAVAALPTSLAVRTGYAVVVLLATGFVAWRMLPGLALVVPSMRSVGSAR